MRLSLVATACVLLGLAPLLSACGEERTAAVGGAAAEAQSRPGASPAGARAQCRSQTHSLLDSLEALRQRLAVGLNYGDYLSEVRALKLVYDRIPVERLAIGCLTTVGTPAERALNRYREAANTWGDCLTQMSCDAEAVEPQLQRRWAQASGLLATAREGSR